MSPSPHRYTPHPDPDPDPEAVLEEIQNARLSSDLSHDGHCDSEGEVLPTPNLNFANNFTARRYSALSSFVFRKVPIHVPYNLNRGSAIVRGKIEDGSSIGDSPIIMPSKDQSVYDARTFLRTRFREQPVLETLAKRLCKKHKIHLETLIQDGPPHVTWMDPKTESSWYQYGDRQTYPILKALFARQTFVIIWKKEGCGIVNGKFDDDYFDRLRELEAMSKTVIVSPEGLVVAAPHRFFLSVILLLASISLAVVSVVFDERTFIERFESGIFVFGFVLLTVPGIFSLITSEPNLLRNAVRGKRILTKQSQVTKYFKLSRRDYAMLATRTRGSKLVSRDIGCFLTGEERGTHIGDEPVVQCEDLAPFGVICGQSVYYRTNWQRVCIANRLGSNQTHLTNELPKVRYWCAGVRQNTWVGFSN